MARLTLAEAARLVRLSRTSLYRAIADGRLTREPDGTVDTPESSSGRGLCFTTALSRTLQAAWIRQQYACPVH